MPGAPECSYFTVCFLGMVLGTMVHAWEESYFLGVGLLAFFFAMPASRWRVAASIGAGVGLVALLILHFALSPTEQAAIHFHGRILPIMFGGILIGSMA